MRVCMYNWITAKTWTIINQLWKWKWLSCVRLFITPWIVILQARILEWVTFPFSREDPNPGIEPRSPALRADSLLSEPPRKPKNIGVGSLSLLQGIFQTQELNWGLLHYRWILYQLSYQGSPHPSEPPQNPLIILMELSPYLTLYRYLRCGIPSIAFILY